MPGTRTPSQPPGSPACDPALVVEGMRSWLKAQVQPDPEAGYHPHVPAYRRCQAKLEELAEMFMSR